MIAVSCFLLWPLRFTFDRPELDGVFGWLFAVLAGFNKPFNQAPSLHITLLVILWVMYQRHTQGLWRLLVHGHCDLIGLGVSAISQIGDLYCQNNSDLTQYQHALSSGQLATSRGLVCNQDDRIRREVIQQIICNLHLPFAPVEHAFNIDFRGYFAPQWPALQRMAADGLIALDAEQLTVLPAGRLLVRSVCMVFDAYLEKANRERFSRVI